MIQHNDINTRILRATVIGVTACGLMGVSTRQPVKAEVVNKETVLNEQNFIKCELNTVNKFIKKKDELNRYVEFSRQSYTEDYTVVTAKFEGSKIEFPEKAVEETVETTNTQPEQIIETQYNEQIEAVEVQEPAYDSFIKNECNASSSFMNDVNNYWNIIPSNIKEAYINSGSTITIRSNLGYLGLSTMYSTGGNIRVDMEIDYRDKAKDSIVHEVGHFLGWYLHLDLVGTQSEFYSIWSGEYTNILSIDRTHINNVNTAHEYFAESFAMYLLKPNQLRQACPRTAEFIQACIESI